MCSSVSHAPAACARLACMLLLTGSTAGLACVVIGGGGGTTVDTTSGTGGATAAGAGGTSSTGAGTSTAGGAAGGGTAGGAPLGCVSPVECDGITNECVERTCVKGQCGTKTLKPAGTKVTGQTPGDCKVAVCGEDGSITDQKDGSDLPDDGNDCTSDTCFDTVPSHEDLPAGTPCGMNKLLSCDGAGTCTGCKSAADCSSPGPCYTWSCEAEVCVKETAAAEGSDCGVCATCQAGQCLFAPEGTPDTDCPNSGVCAADGACQCTDGILDGDEEGVDCGGASCAPCQGTWHCEGDCVVPGCCSACCAGGACSCTDETADCLARNGQPCATAGAVAVFSNKILGSDPTCATLDNPLGVGCASTPCVCQ